MAEDFTKFLDELRTRVPLTEIIGERVKLHRRGRDWVGLCPFHKEKTPSFTVNESRGFYHCFGCGAHGDVVRFVVETENLQYIEAVRKLASRVNMQVPSISRESHEAAQRRKSLYEIMEIATDFYQKCLFLPIGSKALKYLREKRGLSDETIKKFRLGYAPGEDALKAQLLSKGVSVEDMEELGLVSVYSDRRVRVRDFFFERMMIPIMDRVGNIVAFGGRILRDAEPKYLNSPETPIFNKSRILYNLNFAREATRESKRLIICEGYMDVIALDSFNFNYAVAPLGTALTEEQILEAWKVCPTPTLCFDGDSAGIKAAIRSVGRILPILRAGYSVNYIFLKEKKDPDELLHSLGAEAFEQYLNKTKPLVDILWHKCKMNHEIDTPEQKALLEKETFDEVKRIQDPQIRTYYGQEMRKRLNALFGRPQNNHKNRPDSRPNNADFVSQPQTTTFVAPQQQVQKAKFKKNTVQQYHLVKKPPLNDLFIRKIVAAMLNYPQLIAKYEERLTAFDYGTGIMAKILTEILETSGDDSYLDSENLTAKLQLNYAPEIEGLWELDMYKQQKTSLLDLKKEIDSGLIEIQLKQLDTEIKECVTLMKSDTSDAENCYLRYQQLIKERNALLMAVED